MKKKSLRANEVDWILLHFGDDVECHFTLLEIYELAFNEVWVSFINLPRSKKKRRGGKKRKKRGEKTRKKRREEKKKGGNVKIRM